MQEVFERVGFKEVTGNSQEQNTQLFTVFMSTTGWFSKKQVDGKEGSAA